MQRADISRIIAERNAFAPRPSSITRAETAFSKAADEGLVSGISEDRPAAPDARDLSALEAEAPMAAVAAATEARLPQGDDLFQRGLYPEALATWRAAAEQGDRWAAYRLGIEYLDSKPNVVKRDLAEAVKWIRQAAEAKANRAPSSRWAVSTNTAPAFRPTSQRQRAQASRPPSAVTSRASTTSPPCSKPA
ncbi:MAG: hypothetical protein U1F24_06005 [Alphaproteobacteria bacterium]